MIRNLTKGNVTRQLLVFSWPFMVANLLQILYSLIDMAVVGKYVGSVGMSGVSIGGDILHLLTLIGVGYASAGQIIIAQLVGVNDQEGIRRTIGTTFTAISVLGVLFTILGLCLIDPILTAMNTPADAWEQTFSYTIVCFFGTFFIFGYNAVSAILRGMGDANRPLVFIAIAAVLNLVLDLLFVAGFGMEAFGAALATVIGQAVSFVISIVYLYKRRDAFGFDFALSSFKVDRDKLASILKLGTPLALQHCAVSISMLFVNSSVNSFGVIPSAVTGVGNKLRGTMAMVSNSLVTSGSSMIGQNFGAGKHERISRIINVTLLINVVTAAVMSAVVLAFPAQVFGLFNKETEVLAMAGAYVGSLAVSYATFALMAPYNALINGIGHATLAFVIAMLDGVIARVGLSLLLGNTLGLGIKGFWYGNALAGFVTVALGAAYYYSGRWKKRKPIGQD